MNRTASMLERTPPTPWNGEAVWQSAHLGMPEFERRQKQDRQELDKTYFLRARPKPAQELGLFVRRVAAPTPAPVTWTKTVSWTARSRDPFRPEPE